MLFSGLRRFPKGNWYARGNWQKIRWSFREEVDVSHTFTNISWNCLGYRLLYFWTCHCQQFGWMQDWSSISLSSFSSFNISINICFYQNQRIQWIHHVCLDVRYLHRWLCLFTENVHLWESQSKKFCKSLGIRTMFHGHTTLSGSANIRYILKDCKCKYLNYMMYNFCI